MADTIFTNDGLVPVAATAVPVFSPVRIPLTTEQRDNPPVITVTETDQGFRTDVEPIGSRPVMFAECQIHSDMIYLVTRSTRKSNSESPGSTASTGDNEFMLWRQEHGGFAPVRLSKELKHRMLSAPGALKRWQTDELRIHELEVEGRNDLLTTVLIFTAADGTMTEAETHISLGTVELDDSDWLRAWIVILDNGRRIAATAGADYNTTRTVKL